MSFLVALPYVSDEERDACIAGMAPGFFGRVVPINNTDTNLGVAASWNVVARMALEDGYDYLICCSTSTRFGPQGGTDFALILAALQMQTCPLVIESLPPVGWHLIAWHRDLFKQIGFFDENIWPAYGEDIDWSHRVIAHLQRHSLRESWVKVPVDAWITMQGASVKRYGIEPDSATNFAYLERKWGHQGEMHYQHPFNDPANGLDYWPTPERHA